MKKIILALLFLPLATALQFSPPSLEFNLQVNEIHCKEIYFQIESPATLRDIWAQNISDEFSILNFKTLSQQHKLSPSYPSQISQDQNQIEFCLSGSSPGNYKGALIFREEEFGNTIVQFAVWLNVKITGEADKLQEQKPSSSTSKSKSSSSNKNIVYSQQPTEKETTFQPLAFDFPQEEIKLAGKIATNSSKTNPSTILLAALPIILVIALLFLILLRR